MLVDSHCHLDLPELAGNLSQVLDSMQQADVGCAVCIGVTLEDFPRILSIAETCPQVFATVGVHPENTGVQEPTVDDLVKLAAHPRVVGVGETGLDYYWHKDSPEWQRERFRTHIRAARAAGKPLVVHNRDATADTLRVLKEEDAGEVGGVLHCFTETWEVAQAALDLGFYISISGIVTFKNAQLVKDVARRVPLDRLLVETDAPYLAPVPRRGRPNASYLMAHTVRAIADERGAELADTCAALLANTDRVYGTW